MRYKAAALNRKDEIVRRIVIPLLIGAWSLKRVERTIDFDGIHTSRSEVQFEFLWKFGWVELSAPGCVSPAGYTNTRFGHDSRIALISSPRRFHSGGIGVNPLHVGHGTLPLDLQTEQRGVEPSSTGTLAPLHVAQITLPVPLHVTHTSAIFRR